MFEFTHIANVDNLLEINFGIGCFIQQYAKFLVFFI